jgi:hypothetical protein
MITEHFLDVSELNPGDTVALMTVNVLGEHEYAPVQVTGISDDRNVITIGQGQRYAADTGWEYTAKRDYKSRIIEWTPEIAIWHRKFGLARKLQGTIWFQEKLTVLEAVWATLEETRKVVKE